MQKKLILGLLLLVLLSAGLVWAGGEQEEGVSEKAEISVRATQPEWMGQERQIWDVFEEDNPNIKIVLMSVNEGEETAYYAKIAAGDPPVAFGCYEEPDKDNYKNYVNLLEIDFPHWDIYNYDVKGAFEDIQGIPDYVPVANPWAGPYFSFIYNADEMAKTGVDPKHTVKTYEDLLNVFDKVKTYVDSASDKSFVLGNGWIPRFTGQNHASAIANAMGGSLEDQRKVFKGEIGWDDVENNPFARFLEVYKEFYDNGYHPEKWWLSNFEQDFEASFITRKAMFVFHGPWMWDKVLAADPTANLDGFPFPAASDGTVVARPVKPSEAPAMFAATMDKPYWEQAKKAFFWWMSPTAIKMQAEAVSGRVPVVDMSSVGSPNIQSAQYIKVVKPLNEGYWWDWKWLAGTLGEDSVMRFMKPGAAFVLRDDANVVTFGEYFEGKIDLQEVLDRLQIRWEAAYPDLVTN